MICKNFYAENFVTKLIWKSEMFSQVAISLFTLIYQHTFQIIFDYHIDVLSQYFHF